MEEYHNNNIENDKLKFSYSKVLLFSFLMTGVITMSYSYSVVFADQFGQYVVRGSILEKYHSLGGPNSCLFSQLSNEWKGVYDSNDNPVGHIQLFQGGDIHYNPAKNTFIAHCNSNPEVH